MEHESILRRLLEDLNHLVRIIVARLESEEISTTLHLTVKGKEMANFQLNAGDSVVVTVTDTDAVTGAAVTPDGGSVTVVLSSTTDTLNTNGDGTYTITAGATPVTGNTVTVSAKVGGVASKDAVGTYDVVPAVVAPNPTTLAVSFGTETAPAAAPVATAPATGLVAGQINPATGLVNP